MSYSLAYYESECGGHGYYVTSALFNSNGAYGRGWYHRCKEGEPPYCKDEEYRGNISARGHTVIIREPG